MANKQSSKDLKKVRRQLDALLDGLDTNQIEVCLPVSLTRDYLSQHTPVSVAVAEWTEFARYLVSLVVVSTLNDDFKRGGRTGRWVSLPIAAFKSLATNKYQVMRNALLELGILECDQSYSYTQHKTYGYRLGKRYRTQPIKFRHLQSSDVRQKLRSWKRSELQKLKARVSSIAYVAKGWLDYDDISIDTGEALKFLRQYNQVMVRKVRVRATANKASEAELDTQLAWVHNQYLQATHRVEQWGQVPKLSVDDSGGRFYHPLAGLLSPLRNFVTYKGQHFVSLDLKNSQPLHLLMVLRNEFWQASSRQTWSLRNLDEDLWTTLKGKRGDKERRVQSDSPPIKLQYPSQQTSNELSGVAHFASLVLSGKLYEFIATNFQGKFITSKGMDRFATRELAKREMLRIMYFDSTNSHSDMQQPFTAFQRLFPGVADTMTLLKQRHYTDFPILLQKLEAHLMLDKVSRRIYDRAPEAWFTTIHDSILTTPKHADLVQEVLLATYEEVLGVAPAIERSDLHPDAAFDGLFDYVQRKIDKNIGAGETQGARNSRQQVEHWLRVQLLQLTGVDASLIYPFGEADEEHSAPNPFEVEGDSKPVPR